MRAFETGVIVELAAHEDADPESIEFSVQPFARLEHGRKVMAYPGSRVPRVILGLRGGEPKDRLAFVAGALHDEYVDPVSGGPAALRRLIAALGDHGLSYHVDTLRALPFSIEMGRRLYAGLM
jgi:hypothetical protein